MLHEPARDDEHVWNQIVPLLQLHVDTSQGLDNPVPSLHNPDAYRPVHRSAATPATIVHPIAPMNVLRQ